MPPEPRELPRRFYKDVTVGEREGRFAVLLDGRALKTPDQQTLLVPTRALAELIAGEWAAQGERIDPSTMTATRLVNVALDRAPAAREGMAAEVARYAQTDVVCHLSHDPELAAEEEAVWAPLRAWAAGTLGLALEPVAGVRAIPQPAASLEAAERRALGYDDLTLVLLAHATALLGSAVIAFAFIEGRVDAPSAFAASRIDEEHQQARWGVDAEAAHRAARMAAEMTVMERLLKALR